MMLALILSAKHNVQHEQAAAAKRVQILSMFGVPLDQVVARATVRAARVFEAFDDRGTLNPGAPADVAVLELRAGSFEFLDNYKGARTGRQKLFPIATVISGKRAAPRA
jgi:dihydroorotase